MASYRVTVRDTAADGSLSSFDGGTYFVTRSDGSYDNEAAFKSATDAATAWVADRSLGTGEYVEAIVQLVGSVAYALVSALPGEPIRFSLLPGIFCGDCGYCSDCEGPGVA